MIAEGVNGFMEIRGDTLLIRRKLFYGKSKGEKAIPLRSVTSIQFRKAGMLSGFLQAAYSGSQENKGGILDAAKDENTVMFTAKQQKAFETIRSMIDAARLQPDRPAPAGNDLAEKLAGIAQLHRDGVLTDAEFSAAKARILTA